jgi:prolyl-tRNA synthetase
MKALNWYKDFYEQHFAISPYVGLKSQKEKFAGAKNTYTVELVAPNGKALQLCTSHDLSDNFSKVFDIQYLDENGEKKYVYQNSFGLSTRSIGALILAHGDDSGLILPPKVAPIQVIILPISKEESNEDIVRFSENICKELTSVGIRVKLDLDYKHTLGYRINE